MPHETGRRCSYDFDEGESLTMASVDVAGIVNDARLTPAAVRVILHVALMGPGPHNVSRTELAILVGGGDKPVRAAVDRAEHCGYLKSTPAGPAGRKLEYVGNVDNSAPVESVPPGESIEKPIDPLRGGDSVNRVPQGSRLLAVVVDDDEVDTPIVPTAERRLGERAAKAIDRAGEKLAGCRGSLRDYLIARVPDPDRQYGYVQAVVGWMDGLGRAFTQHDGTQAPLARRPGILADALNDLAGSDETKMSRPVGDIANLRTKIDVLLRSDGPRPPRKPRSSTRTGTTGPQQFDYTPTTEFKGFTR